MKQALIYSAKVWLTTLLVGPLLAVSITCFVAWYNPIVSYSGFGFWVDAYFDFNAGLMLLPLALLFWFTVFYMLKMQRKAATAKTVLTIVAIICCILPFVLTGPGMQMSLPSLFSSAYWLPDYLVVAVSCVWMYKLRSNNSGF